MMKGVSLSLTGSAEGRVVTGELEICHLFESATGKQQRIGTRILTLATPDQRLLDQCVAEIDRQQLRLR